MNRMRLTAIGWKADAAVRAAAGVAAVLAPLSASLYLRAAGEILWLGRGSAVSHPRAMACDDWRGVAGAEGGRLLLDVDDLVPWKAAEIDLSPAAAAALTEGSRDLVQHLAPLGEPLGFAMLLGGKTPPFPLAEAAGDARALAAACGGGDAEGAAEAALSLLGLGGGLTPSGDDYVGAAFFARALLAAAAGDAAAWQRAAAVVRDAAPARTHPVSVALLGDLLEGYGHAPLHDLAGALARRAADCTLDAASRLVRLGHTSGWDMLAGFIAGAGAAV